MHLTTPHLRTTARVSAALAALFAVATFTVAPAAHADDASYLAMLNASGAPIPGPDNVRLTTGRYVCSQLRMYGNTGTYRAGTSPGDLIRQLTDTFNSSNEAAQIQIDAAQSELCPESLHR
ncbi:MAG: DUF732 domain-containing protein [Mycobacterium sp.]